MLKLHRIGLLVLSAFLSCSCGMFGAPTEPMNAKGQAIKDKLCTEEFFKLMEISHKEASAACGIDEDCRNQEAIAYSLVVLQLNTTCADQPPIPKHTGVPQCSPRCEMVAAELE